MGGKMSRKIRVSALFCAICALCAAVGCAGTAVGPRAGELYISPHGNFEVPVPSMGLFGDPPTIEEGSDETGGRIAFHDDTGTLKSITYLKLPPGSDDVLADPERREAAVRGFLHDYALPELFRQGDTGAEVLLEEPIGSGLSFEYLAVVRFPEGSVLEDMVSGKRLDSTRTLMIFPNAGYMYMLGSDGGMLGGGQGEWSDAMTESARKALTAFRSTIRFK
jgi:hypothetical protein